MDHCNYYLGNATIFSTIDANSRYPQIEVETPDQNKTVFSSHPGLQNVPRTFPRTSDVILETGKWQLALVHMDDTFIFSRTQGEHIPHILEVLTLFNNAGNTLKLKRINYSQRPSITWHT